MQNLERYKTANFISCTIIINWTGCLYAFIQNVVFRRPSLLARRIDEAKKLIDANVKPKLKQMKANPAKFVKSKIQSTITVFLAFMFARVFWSDMPKRPMAVLFLTLKQWYGAGERLPGQKLIGSTHFKTHANFLLKIIAFVKSRVEVEVSQYNGR